MDRMILDQSIDNSKYCIDNARQDAFSGLETYMSHATAKDKCYR